MRKHLLTVLNYFGYFLYAPSFEEIYTFFPQKISKKNLQILLTQEVSNKKILRLPNNRDFRAFQGFFNHYSLVTNHSHYTLPQYSISWEEKSIRRLADQIQIQNKKRALTIRKYIKILELCPLVRFMGVTGASAMEGLGENDDLDVCIVSKHNFLWTTRFFAVVLAKMLGIHTQAGVCLNLFFDESNLIISSKKNNSYIAHELLQMKPVIDKDSVYERFLAENAWIYRYFPNAKGTQNIKPGVKPSHDILGPLYKYIDNAFRSVQLPIIRRNRTAFFVTRTQLWLFENDFEKKLKQRGLVL